MKILELEPIATNVNIIHAETTNGTKVDLLYSYRSLVMSALRDKDNNTIFTAYPDYRYSYTTSKHIKLFSGYTAKEIENKIKREPDYFKFSDKDIFEE